MNGFSWDSIISTVTSNLAGYFWLQVKHFSDCWVCLIRLQKKNTLNKTSLILAELKYIKNLIHLSIEIQYKMWLTVIKNSLQIILKNIKFKGLGINILLKDL